MNTNTKRRREFPEKKSDSRPNLTRWKLWHGELNWIWISTITANPLDVCKINKTNHYVASGWAHASMVPAFVANAKRKQSSALSVAATASVNGEIENVNDDGARVKRNGRRSIFNFDELWVDFGGEPIDNSSRTFNHKLWNGTAWNGKWQTCSSRHFLANTIQIKTIPVQKRSQRIFVKNINEVKPFKLYTTTSQTLRNMINALRFPQRWLVFPFYLIMGSLVLYFIDILYKLYSRLNATLFAASTIRVGKITCVWAGQKTHGGGAFHSSRPHEGGNKFYFEHSAWWVLEVVVVRRENFIINNNSACDHSYCSSSCLPTLWIFSSDICVRTKKAKWIKYTNFFFNLQWFRNTQNDERHLSKYYK